MKKTICNPININYQFQRDFFSRESADPAIVRYKDDFFLFASHGTGYWVSSDLANWKFIEIDLNKQRHFRLYAPATLVIGDRMYITHSEGGAIIYSDNPYDPDSWVCIGSPYSWYDPAFFLDDDGYVYVYEGCSHLYPLHVSKLDPNDNMRLVEGPISIFNSDYENRGYERIGDFNESEERRPYIEGPWMNKINGKYYLTYAVPGTEFSTYADACAVADSPMGPFTNCDNSPVTYKATGFLRGSGHGALFEDKNGNFWKVETVSISVNHIFERRIALFPAKIGDDGYIYTNTYRGDYPMILPHDTENPFTDADAGWHLISYGKDVCASSFLDEKHAPSCAVDENMKTWWSAASGNAGEWIEIDLGKLCTLNALQINFADQDIEDTHGRGHNFSYKYVLETSTDGNSWSTLIDQRESNDDLSHQYFQLDDEIKVRYVRITNLGDTPAGGKFSISGIRLFGHGGSTAPRSTVEFNAVRCEDERDMEISWDALPDAEGYVIRFGVNPDELHLHWQVIGETSAKIRCLTRGIKYHVTVDAYNDSGITFGTKTILI